MPDAPVATTTVTPAAAPVTPTPTPTAEQLAAAISGQQPAATTPAAPKYRYEVAPNVVYQGDDLEAVVDQMVKAQKSANEHIQTLQTENRQFRTAQQPRAEDGRFVPAAPAASDKFDQQRYFNLLTEDPMSAANYLDGYRFGIPAEQVVPTFNRTVQSSTMAADNLLVTSFFTECPDFPHGDDAAMKALVDTVDQMGGVYTPMSMKAAHRLCVDANKYTPVQTIGAAETPTRPTPLPVPPQGGAHEPAQDYMQMAERMTPAQIREAIAKLEASGVK